MPTWGELLEELASLEEKAQSPGGTASGSSPFDRLRRKYLKLLSKHTGRATIYYGSGWLENKPIPLVSDAY